MSQNDFQQYADKTFTDFLNAARAQGIEVALARAARILDAVEIGVMTQLNDNDKMLVQKFCHVLRENMDSDKRKFRDSYKDELAMAASVLEAQPKH